MDSDRSDHLAVLDSMRGIAAIIVGWLHASLIFPGLPRPPHAHLAVDFFLCLSGFLMPYAYGRRLRLGMSVRGFIVRRLIRLYPMVLLGVVLGGVAMGLELNDGLGGIFKVLPFVVAAAEFVPVGLAFGGEAYPADNPIWSLFFEIVANVGYAVWNDVRLEKLVAVTGLAAIAVVVLAYGFSGVGSIGFSNGPSFCFGFGRVLYPFCVGMVLFRLGLHRTKITVSWVVPGGLLILLLTNDTVDVWSYDAVAVVAAVPALVLLGCVSRPGKSRDVMLLLGSLSYPFYLLHQPIMKIERALATTAGLDDHHAILMGASSMAVSLVVSALVLRHYDAPVRAALWAAYHRRQRAGIDGARARAGAASAATAGAAGAARPK